MNKFMKFLEEKVAPVANKFASNVWVQTIRDSLLQLLPFIFIGSIFSLISIINGYVPNFPIDGDALSGWTFGKLSLFVSFLIPLNYCEKTKRRKFRLVAGCTCLVLFLIMITPRYQVNQVIGFTDGSLGATGMVCAIVAGIYTCLIIKAFSNFSFFKKDSTVPDFIREWFDLCVPIFVVVMTGWILVIKLGVNLFEIIETVFSPLTNGMQILPIFIIFELARTGLYSMGISAWTLTGIWTPAVLAAIAKNQELVAAGTANYHNLSLITNETNNAIMALGGTGATLALSVMLLMAKSTNLKTLGKASIVPSLLNVNEPIVFGCIAWNPIMMIPMILCAILMPCSTWLFTKVIPFCPIPSQVMNFWFCPCPILAFITTKSIQGTILVLINFVISWLVYYPFFRIYDKQQCEKEAAELETK